MLSLNVIVANSAGTGFRFPYRQSPTSSCMKVKIEDVKAKVYSHNVKCAVFVFKSVQQFILVLLS